MRTLQQIWGHQQARRLAAAGVTSLLAGAGLIGLAQTSAASHLPRTDTCTEYGYESGVKFDNPNGVDGTYSANGFTVVLDFQASALGQIMDFSAASQPVSAVVAKGGNTAQLFAYSSPVTAGTGVHAPVNSSGTYADISYLDFCFNPVTTTPTTQDTTPTTRDTTTTTKATTTTTSTPVTGATVPTTPTSAVPATTEAPTTSGPAGSVATTEAAVSPATVEAPVLAYTGDNRDEMLVGGAVLVALGFLLLFGSHRRARVSLG